MAEQHVVVDGSNIATEGRSLPSLAQLEEAVAELRREMPEATPTVVVDATFAHRIDPSERERFEQAARRGEYVYPPAGAIGRGDAFLLRIAQRVDAVVLSNDSFQEFHGEHPWLFDRGRLLGATPVPGVGWIFVPRTPVRGPRSRVAVRDAERSKERVERAIADATREAVAPAPALAGDGAAEDGRRRRRASPPAINEPSTFIAFIAEHRLGELIEAEVESFTSHGAVARAGQVRCYVPLSGLGSPPPRSAREVLRRGERRGFVITALDPYRRGVELALPEVAVVSGHPSDDTVAGELEMTRRRRSAAPAVAEAPAVPRRGARRTAAAPATEAAVPAKGTARRPAGAGRAAKQSEAGAAPAAPARRTPARSEPAAATGAARPAAARKRAGTGKKAPSAATAIPAKTAARTAAKTTKKAAATAVKAPAATARRAGAKSAAATAPTTAAKRAARTPARSAAGTPATSTGTGRAGRGASPAAAATKATKAAASRAAEKAAVVPGTPPGPRRRPAPAGERTSPAPTKRGSAGSAARPAPGEAPAPPAGPRRRSAAAPAPAAPTRRSPGAR